MDITMKIGEVKQCIIPDNGFSFSFNYLMPNSNVIISYQIGLSIEEKAFMQINRPESNNHFTMIITYSDLSKSTQRIEVGRTYIYEPGDNLHITNLSFIPEEWENIYGELITEKAYLEIIAFSQNKKTEKDYLDQEEQNNEQ